MSILPFDGVAQEALEAFDLEKGRWRMTSSGGRHRLIRNNDDHSMTTYEVQDAEVGEMVIAQAAMRAALASVDG